MYKVQKYKKKSPAPAISTKKAKQIKTAKVQNRKVQKLKKNVKYANRCKKC